MNLHNRSDEYYLDQNFFRIVATKFDAPAPLPQPRCRPHAGSADRRASTATYATS
jgi:hypothetical protein